MSGPPSDLIDRMRVGDESSLEDVVTWYSQDILRLAYLLMGRREEALDVLQETLLKFVHQVRRHEFYSRNGSIKGFLLTCARNLCIDRLRQRKKQWLSLEEDFLPEEILSTSITPRDVEEEKRFYAAVDQALDLLPLSQRVAFVLFEFKGESYQEIAKALELSIPQVKSRLHRARRTLRLLLEQYRSE